LERAGVQEDASQFSRSAMSQMQPIKKALPTKMLKRKK